MKAVGQRIGEGFSTFDAADIRRDDRDLRIAHSLRQRTREKAPRLEMHGANAKSVFESREVVDIQCHHTVDTHAFQQRRNVTRRQGIAGLASPIFARVAEIGQHDTHPLRGGILQCAREEKQPDELVVDAVDRIAEQRLHHIGVVTAYALQGPGLVLAVLELPLLVRSQPHPEP